VVDHQVHWYPPSAVEQLIGRSSYPKAERDADGNYVLLLDEGISQPLTDRLAVDLDEHLKHTAEAGVDVLVLGPATMGEVMHLPVLEAVDLLEHVHLEYADAQRAHPDHVVALAALPMQEPSVALKVLDHAIGDLGLRGVSLLTTVDEKRPLVTEDRSPCSPASRNTACRCSCARDSGPLLASALAPFARKLACPGPTRPRWPR
jgi:aminocarboxymuconate-semialdehyde decarboxylase